MAGEFLLPIIFTYLFPFSSSSFSPIFLSCGSSSAVNVAGDNPPRTFKPDAGYLLSPTTSQTATFPITSSPSLHSTARIFTSQSSYSFDVDPNAFYILRLHFLPFPSTTSSSFNVSALHRFLLLSSFSPSSFTIKEFFLWVDTTPLLLTFSPAPTAFINALELLSPPPNLINGSQPLYITPSQTSPLTNFSPQAAETLHRINVGGPPITPANDTFWRTWDADDAFLFNAQLSVRNHTNGRIEYLYDSKIAPETVYSTARTMNVAPVAGMPSFDFNVTWSFKAPPEFQYLVRLHFCNCWFPSPATFFFDVYLQGLTAWRDLSPGKETNWRTMVPFYIDLLVDAPKSGLLNVTIGKSSNSQPPNALLNGVEIMKLSNSFNSLAGAFGLSENSGGDHGVENLHLLTILLPSVFGGIVLLALLSFTTIQCRRRRLRIAKQKKTASTSWTNLNAAAPAGNSAISESTKSADGQTPKSSASPRLNLSLQIPFADIMYATRNFDDKLVVGGGGFGIVYKGVLPDGTKVAVKRGRSDYRQGFPEFQTEIVVLSGIRHRHLVSLVGYCDENSEMILVYEYMEKGTLRSYLHDSKLPSLSWKQRLEICVGAARGLHYLHTGYSQSIIHRDVKSTNILLDEHFVAKVSDFGLSRVGPSFGETHVSTGVKGTFGYFDPEYFKIQKLTDKSDVYSFGVVLFEVLCARPAIADHVNLAELALHWQKKGQLERIVDPKLRGEVNENSMRKFGETAAKCLADYGVDRPSIGDVLWNLEYALQLQETRLVREPFEDSGIVDGRQIAMVAPARGTPEVATERRSSPEVSEMSNSLVFSQLVTDEGR